ncbi:heme-dependent oxidative N-demethylase family protein [Pontivivens insulae]|uniref:DUF3445 domain-containing protein n=1 Tax=Pontivivens insulae TaxID=1639689 RepID=A0A2R8ABP2_9RHOB|nr:DUF3445 domain-containing protein [Pontivivens insulae]SPF29478.1 hypothetical protein POI8812_01789 [Pontivivens insulae]
MARVPGMRPFDLQVFPQQDACFAAQMAERDRLVAAHRDDVLALRPEGQPALHDLEQFVLDRLKSRAGYEFGADAITRPDGVIIPNDLPSLERLGRLVQEDLLLLVKTGAEWRLVAGMLCFPSHWTLSQKMGRGLDAIHGPVPFYAETLGARVARLFDTLRPKRPLRRANWLLYPDAELHYPKREGQVKYPAWTGEIYLRVEHQSLIALPATGAVLFAIRTEISPVATLPTQALEGLVNALDALPEVEFDYKGGAVLRRELSKLRKAP